jgi:integrase
MDIQNFLASAFPYAESSKRTYQDVITKTLQNVPQLGLSTLDPSQLINLIKSIPTWGNNRQCLALHACKKYLAWAYGANHPALTAKIKRQVGKEQRAFDHQTALQLLASFNPHEPKGARDLAMCALLLDTGLRASEICTLQQAHTDTHNLSLQVITKGGQWEIAIFTPQTALHIEHWKAYRKIKDGQGFLFHNIRTGKGLTPEGLYQIIKDWGKEINIVLGPHDFRRSMAGIATIMNNTPERTLMDLGRWKSTDMIKKYTRHLRLEQSRKHLVTDAIMKPKA